MEDDSYRSGIGERMEVGLDKRVDRRDFGRGRFFLWCTLIAEDREAGRGQRAAQVLRCSADPIVANRLVGFQLSIVANLECVINV